MYFTAQYVLFQGDYGGPVVASNRLVGMYSWGLECGLPQYPGVYIKVSALCDWIVNNADLYKTSAVISWIKTIPGLQTMQLIFIATYPKSLKKSSHTAHKGKRIQIKANHNHKL